MTETQVISSSQNYLEQLPCSWLIANSLEPDAAAVNRESFQAFCHCIDQASAVFQPEETGDNALRLVRRLPTQHRDASVVEDNLASQITLQSLIPLAEAVHQFDPDKLEDYLNNWPNDITLPIAHLALLTRQGKLSGPVLIRCLKGCPVQRSRLSDRLLDLEKLRIAHRLSEDEFWSHAFRCLDPFVEDDSDSARLQATIQLMIPTLHARPEKTPENTSEESSVSNHELFNRNRPTNLLQAMRYFNRFAHTNFVGTTRAMFRLAQTLMASGPLEPNDLIAQWMNRLGTPELAPLFHRLCGERPFPTVNASDRLSLVMAVINDPPPPNDFLLNQLLHSLHDVNPGRHLLPFSDILRLADELSALQQPRIQPEIIALCLEAMLPETELQRQSIATRSLLLYGMVSSETSAGPSDRLQRLRTVLLKWQIRLAALA